MMRVEFYREPLVGIGIDCGNEGTEASKDLLLLGTCGRAITQHVSNKNLLVCFMFCVLCFVSYAGWEPS